MILDHNKVLDLLRNVRNPNTGIDIITSKMVSDYVVTENTVSFTLQFTSNDNGLKSALHQACVEAIQGTYPKTDVHIHLKTIAEAGAEQMVLPQIKNIIAVASGKGGVGKSTISVNLAATLSKLGYKVGLLDADLYGPSIPTMLGVVGQRPRVELVYGKHKIVPLKVQDISVMSIGFVVEPEQAVVLRGPRLAGLIKQFLHDCLWPELDYLVIDLPPGTGDIQLTLVQTIPITGVLMVTTPQEVAVIDAVKAMNMFLMPNVNVPILGVVENMSWFTPAELPDNKYYIFGEGGGDKLASLANGTCLAKIPIVMEMRKGGDEGNPVAYSNQDISETFEKLGRKVIQQVKLRNEMLAPTQTVTVK